MDGLLLAHSRRLRSWTLLFLIGRAYSFFLYSTRHRLKLLPAYGRCKSKRTKKHTSSPRHKDRSCDICGFRARRCPIGPKISNRYISHTFISVPPYVAARPAGQRPGCLQSHRVYPEQKPCTRQERKRGKREGEPAPRLPRNLRYACLYVERARL